MKMVENIFFRSAVRVVQCYEYLQVFVAHVVAPFEAAAVAVAFGPGGG
jgi:hypothetical protein